MIDELKWIIYLTEVEYRGHSFNGKALTETVENLSIEEVYDEDMYENFSVWSIVLHNAFFKWKLIEFFKPGEVIFPYSKKSFPELPEKKNEKNWKEMMTFSNEIHNKYINLLKDLNKQDLDKRLDEWECSAGEAIAWAATHDSYHNAQIRNMGINSLKTKK